MEVFLHTEAWVALLTLTFLEIVLGIDNIIFISIAANKLEEKERKKATNIGLVLAMVLRIILLFGISYLIAMEEAIFNINTSWLKVGITGQSIILFFGGLFLLYKSTKEIHHKVEGFTEEDESVNKSVVKHTITQAIVQITLINMVFSFDSILTAVGMTNKVDGAFIIMIVSIILSMIIMMLFATPVGDFVNKHPSIQMLGLSFLILIGFMLITESAHLSDAEIFGNKVGVIPKGYLYFAIAFSLGVEMLNMKLRGNKKK